MSDYTKIMYTSRPFCKFMQFFEYYCKYMQ